MTIESASSSAGIAVGTGALSWAECLGTLVLAAVPVTVLELGKLVRRGLSSTAIREQA